MSRSSTISEWFHQYSHDIYNFLVYYTGNTEVEDLVQEVFIKAIKGLHTYQSRSSPKTWLFSIARNVAVDEARKRKSKVWYLTRPLNEDEIWDGQTPEELLYDNEAKKHLYVAIQALRKNYREVLLLRGLQELTVKETAAVLNWREDKVRTTYHRALKALRKQQGGC